MLSSNYILGELIGRGGTSEVFAATHRFLGESVAIKIVRADLALDDEQRQGFVAEAVKTRAVAHPNVVRVLDAGRADDGRCYLVMEHLDGESLATRVRRGRLDEDEARRLGAGIADGMQAVHACGLVHRDLKPANVMLVAGAPKIVDFGIAKSLGGGDAAMTARTVGTLGYMAPEQIAGGLITPRVDVWALGVILFEMVTGQLPFSKFEDGRCPQLVDTPPRASMLATISRDLDGIIARCLARDPNRRFASMREVAAALRGETAEVGGEEERMTEDLGPAEAPRQRHSRKTAWIVVGVLLVGAAGAAFALGRSHGTTAPATAPTGSAVATVSIDAGSAVASVGVDAGSAVAVAPPQQPPPAPALIDVELRTVPRGAAIMIDGVKQGTTPRHVSVAPGTIVELVYGRYKRRVQVDRAGVFALDLGPFPPQTHPRHHGPHGETLD